MTTHSGTAALMVQGRDVPWLFNQWVQRTPNNIFLIWAPKEGQHQQWTYHEFEAEIRKAAGGLIEQGIEPGQRLLIHLENCPEHLISYFACAYLGVTAVLTNTRSTGSDLEYFCQLTEVVGAITQPQFAKALVSAAPQLKFIAVTETDAGISAETTETTENPSKGQQSHIQGKSLTPKLIPFKSLQRAEPYKNLREPQPMQDLRVQFTSGTTSRPKAVLSTHANSLFAAQQTSMAYGLKSSDVGHCVVPLFHTNGLSVVVMGTLWSGGTVLLQRKFSISNFWELALKYKATWASLPSTFFLRALASRDVPKHFFRFWFCGVLPEIEARYKLKTRGHWGMTEMITLPIVGGSDHSEPRLSIGRPAVGNEIAIRHPDGTACKPGETGALFVKGIRGITLFKEYLNNPKATAQSFDKDGWFITGDRIRIGPEGNLFFADREKDILRVGGENVAASEIEAVLTQLDWIQECAVVAQKHPMLDEVPVAFVRLKPNAPQANGAVKQALLDHCQQNLADFKMIRDVHIVDDFPRSTLHKIAKNQLRERLEIAPVSE